jgi:hypothetical protein
MGITLFTSNVDRVLIWLVKKQQTK